LRDRLIQQAGGKLQIQSQSNGTTIRIRLPLLDTPQWFYDISKSDAASIVALDDDLFMKQRLELLFPDRPISVFATEDEFLKFLPENHSSLILVDYDYGGTRSGIELIVAEGLTKYAVLLSGRLTFDHQILIV
jgi:hypothetical protein